MEPEIKPVEDLFVLSGGGARGMWQWEVLNALHAKGYSPSFITGTSTGALGAFMWAKGLISEAYDLYDKVSKSNAAEITSPGIAKIKNGKLEINWVKLVPKLLFGRNKIKSLMSNQPLIDLLVSLCTKYPEFKVPFSCNVVSLHSGKLLEFSSSGDFDDPVQLGKAIAASTTIPVVWEPIDALRGVSKSYKKLIDGGVRAGSPLSQAFGKMLPDKEYRIWVLNCNRVDMDEDDQLNNVFDFLGRTGSIGLNEILLGDLQVTLERNKIALELKEIYGEDYVRSGYRHIPINIIEYSGNRGVFEFTEESFREQKETAHKDVDIFLSKLAIN